LKREAETNLLLEICGLISFKENFFIYKRMNNLSDQSNIYFKINPKDYLDFLNSYGCFCIFHSHLCSDETLSKIDVDNSNNCCKSFLVYSILSEKFNLYEPKNKDYDVNITKQLMINL
jgi:proteasome lid subunit RPN8/RPN11